MAERPPRRGLAAGAAFFAGAGVLALEITGARLLTPWFGASIHVWSNVIGVTLLAVAAGNVIGGRFADRSATWPRLASLLAAAGAGTMAAPCLVGPIAARYLPPDLPLEVSFALIGKASLLVSLVCLAPPLVLLGMATPFLVRLVAREGKVGRSVGLVSGAATLGSLVGTWLPVHVLIPSLGSARTLFLAAAALFVVALLLLLRERSRAAAAAGLAAALAVVCALAPGAIAAYRPVAPGARVLEEGETRYQYYRVEKDGNRTLLRLNEGLDSFHSLTVDGRILTGAYFDWYALFVPPRPRGRFRVAVLGHAAGTIPRILLQLFPDADLEIVGVEIDPRIAALGPRWFGLPDGDPRLRVVADQDARVFVDHGGEAFDLIVVDAYGRQIYVPFQLCSREFFAAARRRLAPGGLLLANLSGFSAGDAPVRAICNTAAAVFGEVGLLRVPEARNFVLIADREGEPRPPSPQPETPAPLRALFERLKTPGLFHRRGFDPKQIVLSDDRSPIERLADQDLARRAEEILASGEGGG